MLKTLSLDGAWKVRPCDGHRGRAEHATRATVDATRYFDALVPGEAHLDAHRAGLIPDPYVGANALAARWVEEYIWAYRREFDCPPELLDDDGRPRAGVRAWLVFDGLDYAATIHVNGGQVGSHHNVFYPCRVDVTGQLRSGMNVLAVLLDSGLHHTAHLNGEGLPGTNDIYQPKRTFLRKPQCQFSWDWSIRFVNVGIFKPVRLEWTEAPARLDQLVPLVEMSGDLSRGTVRVRQFVEGLGEKPVFGTISAEIVEAGVKVAAPVDIAPGLKAVETTLNVEKPELWWPVGHGEQKLYTLRVTIEVGGIEIGRRTAHIGFRRVAVNQDVHPSGGRYFIIEINNKPIFAKGGNFVPADMIYARIDRQRYERLTDLALEANFNMLRIWGGGMYEADEFYDLCDRKGILVWQEFIFACGRYPATDPAFVAEIRAEATWNVRRLASHPSLVIWCGNNEMEEGTWYWGYDRTGVTMPDYALFHYVLPRLLSQEDPTRFYWPSSPYSPYSPGAIEPNAPHIGDQHPWQVGFKTTDYRRYRTMSCRFPNEGGLLGPTSLPTILKCVGDDRPEVNSWAWQLHDNSIDSSDEPSWPNAQIHQHLGKDIHAMTMEEWCYWGGLVQGDALREYCDNFRRRMFDNAAAIFWMYNDTWPVVRSWTIVDYDLRRTPSFHPVRRAMAPVSVVVAEEGERIVVYGINETADVVRGSLRFGVFNLAGGCPLDRTLDVALLPNASTRIAWFEKSLWNETDRSAAFAVLSRDGQLLARNRLILPLLKEMSWPGVGLSVRVVDGRAVFESSAFVIGVCLDLDGEASLADNFFDVYPDMPYSIPWPHPAAPRVLRTGNLV